MKKINPDLANDYTTNTIQIYSAYNKEFISGIKTLKGFWNEEEECWIIKAENIEAARELAKKAYGYTTYTTKTLKLDKDTLNLGSLPSKITYCELSADNGTIWKNGKHYIPANTTLTLTVA